MPSDDPSSTRMTCFDMAGTSTSSTSATSFSIVAASSLIGMMTDNTSSAMEDLLAIRPPPGETGVR